MKSKKQSDELVGQYFHSMEGKTIVWQGTVLSSPCHGWYLVQLFEWLAGEPNVRHIIPIEDMKGWRFYPTGEEMADYYDRYSARAK